MLASTYARNTAKLRPPQPRGQRAITRERRGRDFHRHHDAPCGRAEAHCHPVNRQRRRAVFGRALDELRLLGKEIADNARQFLELGIRAVVLVSFHGCAERE